MSGNATKNSNKIKKSICFFCLYIFHFSFIFSFYFFISVFRELCSNETRGSNCGWKRRKIEIERQWARQFKRGRKRRLGDTEIGSSKRSNNRVRSSRSTGSTRVCSINHLLNIFGIRFGGRWIGRVNTFALDLTVVFGNPSILIICISIFVRFDFQSGGHVNSPK